ncbi:MAG: serine hydrolase [Armatimonadetes bacterium]|nr:serine hydrolase [Armatimonadota bacterium]
MSALLLCLLASLQTGPGPTISKDKRTSPEEIGRFSWGDASIPIQGEGQDFAAPYDKIMTNYLRKVGAPGGALVVYYRGKQVYSKGFGYADVDTQSPFEPSMASRISSVSKFLTQSAIKILIEDGRLDKDEKIMPILKKGGIVPLTQPDPRLKDVTIQQLLDHKSGLEAGLNIGDYTSADTIKQMGLTQPLDTKQVLGVILSRKLEADPGKTEIYSNCGYALLGQIIEIVSGQSYETFVKENVIAPVVKPDHWFVTTASRTDKRPTEPDYYSTRSLATWDAFHWNIFQGAGGWVVPTNELADFFQRVFPGEGWDYTLFGSYIGAVTVMKVHENSLTYAASVNYRRGNGPNDNEVLYNMLEEATKSLTLP